MNTLNETLVDLTEAEAVTYLKEQLAATDVTDVDRVRLIIETLDCIDQCGLVPLWVTLEYNLYRRYPDHLSCGIRFSY